MEAWNFKELEEEALTGITGVETAWGVEHGADRCVKAAIFLHLIRMLDLSLHGSYVSASHFRVCVLLSWF